MATRQGDNIKNIWIPKRPCKSFCKLIAQNLKIKIHNLARSKTKKCLIISMLQKHQWIIKGDWQVGLHFYCTQLKKIEFYFKKINWEENQRASAKLTSTNYFSMHFLTLVVFSLLEEYNGFERLVQASDLDWNSDIYKDSWRRVRIDLGHELWRLDYRCTLH